MNCKRCNSDIPIINLSEEGLLNLWGLITQDLKIVATQQLIKTENYSHKEAKQIIAHFNSIYGSCHRCNYEELVGDFIECPKCKAFNYNITSEPPFNKDFCSELEHRLDFSRSNNINIKGFWCDGVSHLPADFTRLAISNLRETREIITEAKIGVNGQIKYGMKIKFGELAL